MAIKKGLVYDQSQDRIVGYTDDGESRTNSLATQVLTVMACGIMKKWKQPIGYFFSSGSMKGNQLREVIKTSIHSMEEEGFVVLGLTSLISTEFILC